MKQLKTLKELQGLPDKPYLLRGSPHEEAASLSVLLFLGVSVQGAEICCSGEGSRDCASSLCEHRMLCELALACKGKEHVESAGFPADPLRFTANMQKGMRLNDGHITYLALLAKKMGRGEVA
ncbi:hypothetical protein NQZ68_038502 [Dissostichus eleginoides]|nr:hypothetical protein NQZ68_038502 [Dissostichus eleginoides]